MTVTDFGASVMVSWFPSTFADTGFGVTHVVRVVAFEAEDNPVLIVHSNRMVACEIVGQRMESITGRNLQVSELRDGVELIQLPPDDRPERGGSASTSPVAAAATSPSARTFRRAA